MNRRSFLQIIAAAAALPVFPKIKTVRTPVRIEWNGYVFTEDPNPLRFVLTPDSGPDDLVTPDLKRVMHENSDRDEYCREQVGWFLNPAWQALENKPHMTVAFHPDAFRRWEGQGPKVGVKTGPRCA